MSERNGYEGGTPCWADLSSPEIQCSIDFYAPLFGWEATEAGPPEETEGYTMFSLRGKQVAAVGPIQGEGRPPWWNTYVSVDSADDAARRVRTAGGEVLMEPFDVLGSGRMAIFADPQAAIFCAWEPREHFGAQLVNEPGAMTWNELATRQPEAAKGFYEPVFGWRAEPFEMEGGAGADYALWMLGDAGVAGMIRMTEEWPPEVPPHWMVYFAVEDADETAQRAEEHGGKVSIRPTDIPLGRFAVLNDPHGAVFSIIRLNEPGARPTRADA
jgi:predicted enzyme related to lactoylglutathione lyase